MCRQLAATLVIIRWPVHSIGEPLPEFRPRWHVELRHSVRYLILCLLNLIYQLLDLMVSRAAYLHLIIFCPILFIVCNFFRSLATIPAKTPGNNVCA